MGVRDRTIRDYQVKTTLGIPAISLHSIVYTLTALLALLAIYAIMDHILTLFHARTSDIQNSSPEIQFRLTAIISSSLTILGFIVGFSVVIVIVAYYYRRRELYNDKLMDLVEVKEQDFFDQIDREVNTILASGVKE